MGRSRSREPGKQPSRGIVALALLVSAAIGAMIAVLILWKPDPHTLVPDRSSGGTVAVVARDEDDSRPVDLDIESGPTVRVLSPVSGTVTESSCRAGVEIGRASCRERV